MSRSDLCVLTILSWPVISRGEHFIFILLLPWAGGRGESRRKRSSDDGTAREHVTAASDTQMFIETQEGGRRGRQEKTKK